jgi:hypothetical protein
MALPRNFVIGMLVFCVFIVGGIYLVGNFGVSGTKTQEFNATFEKVNDLTSQTESIKASITNSTSSDFGAFGVLNGLINSAWTSLKIVFTTQELAGTVITDSATFLGLPKEALIIGTLITAIIIIFVSFSIWSAIFQRDL